MPHQEMRVSYICFSFWSPSLKTRTVPINQTVLIFYNNIFLLLQKKCAKIRLKIAVILNVIREICLCPSSIFAKK